jgi:uncharacterized cupin superfamily protein
MNVITHASAPLQNTSWTPLDDARIIEGNPQATHLILYTSPSGELVSGIYECTKGKWKVAYVEDEFCTLIEGRICLTNMAGEAQYYAAPESFLIPSGYEGTWEAITPVRQTFCHL